MRGRDLWWVRVRSSSWLPNPASLCSVPSLGRDPATGLWQKGRSVCRPPQAPPPPALFPGRLVWLARESLSHLRCQSRRQREPVCQEVPKGENSRGQRPMPPLPGVRTRSGLTTHLCLQAQVPSVLPVTCHLQRRDPGLRHLQEASAGPQREESPGNISKAGRGCRGAGPALLV